MQKRDKEIPLLEIRDVSKSFPGVRALDSVSLCVRSGSVHALMGENGAGKSTLMKCLFGVHKKDGGEILLNGKPVEFSNSRDALSGGVAMVHQELNQALKLTVMENIWLGRFPRVAKFIPLTSERKMYAKTKELFSELGIETDPKAKMETLSVSKRQMVEIAKAISYNSQVIVFDEPTSSLNEREAERLFEIISALKKRGCGIIYISHKMEEILRISDEVTVMRDGKKVATSPAKSITTDEIIRLMVGRELTERFPKKENAPGETLLRINNLSSRASGLSDASLTLKKGEILGVAGLDGSGRTELLETIFGIREKSSGDIELDGKRLEIKNPRDAKKHGFALITEERRESGIFAILSIRENATISSLKKYRKLFLLSKNAMMGATEACISSMKVKTPSQETSISSLSGGNQQKVILGRWLLTKPVVLLLDEPTRGIDVGAKHEIYKLIIELSREDKGIIIVSSEMSELIGICDRIIVMSGGRVAGEVERDSFSQETIMRLATKYV